MLTYKSYFFIGIKGVMMANLAIILKKKGLKVSGADLATEFITDSLLAQNNISYFTQFSEKILPEDTDCIVYAASHNGLNNPIVVAGKKRNIKIISQTELVSEFMVDFKTKIAVSGCHGKTTTSSLLSHCLIKLGTMPSYCVGVPFFGETQGGDYQGNDYFVVEADEYGVNPPFDKTPKFRYLNPDYVICTNIDFDHPDVYQNLEETKNAYIQFFNNKKLILCIDDPVISDIISQLKYKKLLTYGLSSQADYQVKEIKNIDGGTQFRLFNYGKSLGMFKTPLYGQKNVLNTTAVVVQLLELGFTTNKIDNGLQGFRGAERRMQKIYENDNFQLYDDYAHHPNEIQATIDAFRQRFSGKRLIIIFQPHTFSRTKSLLKDFVSSLAKADVVYLLPIFASAREKQDPSIDSSAIAKLLPDKITCFENRAQVIQYLPKNLLKGDIIVTMGAGDVYKLKDDIIKIISNF